MQVNSLWQSTALSAALAAGLLLGAGAALADIDLTDPEAMNPGGPTFPGGIVPTTNNNGDINSAAGNICEVLKEQGYLPGLDLDTDEYYGDKIDPPANFSNGDIEVVLYPDAGNGPYVYWKTEPGWQMLAMVIKGGPSQNIYIYDGTTIAEDANLQSPLLDNNNLPDVSHYQYCYKKVDDDEITYNTDTAYAFGDKTLTEVNGRWRNWGWQIGEIAVGTTDGSEPLWAGAGQNNTDNGTEVGSFDYSYLQTNDTCTFTGTFNLDSGNTLDESHLYVGFGNTPTNAPGQFAAASIGTRTVSDDGTAYVVTFDALCHDLYVLAHGVVTYPAP